MKLSQLRRVVALGAALLAIAVAPVFAEGYPSKPIQLVAAVPVGSATDLLARQVAEKLGGRIGGTVIVVSKPGGGTQIATDFVAKAAPDGHTLLLGNSALVLNPFLYKKLPYDLKTDFANIALIGESPYVVVVNNDLGVKNMKELFALAKAKPKSINFASGGLGSATHMACELLANKAGVQFTHVPYANTAAIATDLQSNTVQMMCSPPASIIPLVRNGRVTIIGVSTPAAMTDPIQVPSVKESTGVDFIANQWFGVLAPRKTPADIQQRIAKAIESVLQDPDFRSRLKDQGLEPHPLFLKSFDAFVQKELDLWAPVVKASGLKLD